jgi:hypothetical protein
MYAGAVAAQEPCARLSTAAPGSLTGIVSDASGAPIPGMAVTAHWRSWEYSRDRLVERTRQAAAPTDSAGRYVLCGVPDRVQLRVELRSGTRVSPQVVLSPARSAARRLDLMVSDDPATASLELVDRTATASISGIVVDSAGAAVPGATISVAGGDAAALTDETGKFGLAGVSEGEHVLSIRRLGFAPDSRRVKVSADAPTRLTWILDAVPVRLEEVVRLGTASEFELSSGFAERRRRGPGVFFDRGDIESRRPQNLTDLLRTVSGFRVHRALTRWGYQTTATLERVPSGSVGCPLDYYVNGHEYTPTSMGIDSDVPAAQIEAIEIYKPSQTPPQFVGMRSRCGAVVIWTRYRAHELDG